MLSGSQRSDRRNTALASLVGVTQVLSVAKDVCGFPPAQIALGSACALLTTIKDTMGNKDDYIGLGLSCAEVCRVLDQGLEEMDTDELSKAAVDAIDRLKATITSIQGKIVEKNERGIASRAFFVKSDKDEIATWKQEFKTILEIFNTELHIGVLAGVNRIRRDFLASNRQYMASNLLGELPPPAPKAFFGRDALIEEIVSLAEKFEPIALVGAGGIGKTSVALSILHHDRIKRRFRDDRRFLRCDGFTTSLPNFLSQLSKVIGAGVENPENLASLRPFLSSAKIFLILDNAESMFDPEGTDSREILAAVEELCQFERVCVCITSRITTVPQHCKHPMIPTLSMEAACDIFYGIYNIHGRSSSVEELMRLLEFHPLSISLLAATASHNRWDYDRLTKEWNDRRAEVLQTHGGSLAATITLSLESPTFLKLGPDAQALLGVVAFFPQGVGENNLEWLFPDFPDIKSTFDKFCALSLTRRSDSRITMLAPIRDHLTPRDPTSSPLLCDTKDRYFTRLSVDLYPGKPGYEEAQWIVSEDVNVEHLLDVFTSVDMATDDVWDACAHFLEHLCYHKKRKTALAQKVEDLTDDHPLKPQCLFQLSELLGVVGNYVKQKQLLTHVLELERKRMDRLRIARALKRLSDANRLLDFKEEGIQQAEEALEIFEEFGDTTEQLDALNALGMVLCEADQPDAAQKVVSRAIDLAPEQGQEYHLCGSHYVLGYIYQRKGQKKEAIRHCEIALSIASHFKWHNQLKCHVALAELFLSIDELDKANTHAGQAKLHVINDAYGLGRVMEVQAWIWGRQDKFEDAKLEASCALEIFEKLGATQDVEDCRTFLLQLDEPICQYSSHEVHRSFRWRTRLRTFFTGLRRKPFLEW